MLLLVLGALFAGLGQREPVPADEPRFALAARNMVESGDWLFPRRGTELYADKPPLFMWAQAGSYLLVRDWRIAFLLPSVLAALATLWLAGDLASRLWGARAGRWAALGLFACLQFGLQAKRAQIDMVLVAMTTLSLWALARHLLERPRGWLAGLAGVAAGLGTVTKGVGFLPLLAVVPWLWLRHGGPASSRPAAAGGLASGIAGFLLGTGAWLVPMLAAALVSGDPALHEYAREILFRQTGERYAAAWHHVKPAWYYLQVMATLWLPGILLLPWLARAWRRRWRRRDARVVVLVGWAVMVLAFFSFSPGKREVYIFPALPALCVAAAPLLPALLRGRGPRRVLWGYLWCLAGAATALGAWLVAPGAEGVARLAERHGVAVGAVAQAGAWMLGFGVLAFASTAVACRRAPRTPGPTVVAVSAALWIATGVGLMPALNRDSAAVEVMARVARQVGPDAGLAMVGWREQHFLQAHTTPVDFGFSQPLDVQWSGAGSWLAADPRHRWVFFDAAVAPGCIDQARTISVGASNRRDWLVARGDAWRAGCTVDAR